MTFGSKTVSCLIVTPQPQDVHSAVDEAFDPGDDFFEVGQTTMRHLPGLGTAHIAVHMNLTAAELLSVAMSNPSIHAAARSRRHRR